jgi:hypothetical protein
MIFGLLEIGARRGGVTKPKAHTKTKSAIIRSFRVPDFCMRHCIEIRGGYNAKGAELKPRAYCSW